MPDFTVTKQFHRTDAVRADGDVIVTKMPFACLDAAIAFGEDVNARYADLPYHVVAIVLDSQNFCLFDRSQLVENIPGFSDLGWNLIREAEQVPPQRAQKARKAAAHG